MRVTLSLLILSHWQDAKAAEQLEVDFGRRNLHVRRVTVDPHSSLDRILGDHDAIVIVISRPSLLQPNVHERLQGLLQTLSTLRKPILSVVFSVDGRYLDGPQHPNLYVDAFEGYDSAFERLFEALLHPIPRYLKLICRPSLFRAPTGATWWDNDAIVADESLGNVVRISPGGHSHLLTALLKPHHIHLDREKLLVAHTDGHEIVMANLEGGAARDVRRLPRLGSHELLRPHGVHQAHRMTVVADTNNHRILFTHDDLWRGEAEWRQVGIDGLWYPSYAHVDGYGIWIADMFGNRVIRTSRDGHLVATFGEEGDREGELNCPVAVHPWRSYLFVAEEVNQRLQVFKVSKAWNPTSLSVAPFIPTLGFPWLVQPYGLSVNHFNELLVADRFRGCLWKVFLEEVFLQGVIGGTKVGGVKDD